MNWQTCGTQNPVVGTPYGFDPHRRHHKTNKIGKCSITQNKEENTHEYSNATITINSVNLHYVLFINKAAEEERESNKPNEKNPAAPVEETVVETPKETIIEIPEEDVTIVGEKTEEKL